MTALASFHPLQSIKEPIKLSAENDKKKKSISGSPVLSPFSISFRLNYFESLLLAHCFRRFLQTSLDTTNKQIKVGGKKTIDKKSHKKHGQFPTCRHLIMENNSTWL